jgi:hypothetical protein
VLWQYTILRVVPVEICGSWVPLALFASVRKGVRVPHSFPVSLRKGGTFTGMTTEPPQQQWLAHPIYANSFNASPMRRMD